MIVNPRLFDKSSTTYSHCFCLQIDSAILVAMIITEDKGSGTYRIQAYAPGEIQVNEQTYHRSLLITADRLVPDWPPQSLAELSVEHLATIIELDPKVVLLGTGPTFIVPNKTLISTLREKGIGVEFMDSSAACRTFIALTAEGRQVLAAILMK